MIACDISGVRFNYRAAAVCIEDSYVLLHRINGMDFWFLPGGRVEVRETSAEALHREMWEELGIQVRIGRLLWIVESFFQSVSQSYHELGLYYEVAMPLANPYSDKDVTHARPTASGDDALFSWFPLDALHELTLVPPFLKDGLSNLPRQTQHRTERR